MRRLLVGAALFFCIFFFTRLVIADRGVVIGAHDNKYVILHGLGFLLVEWYGGYQPYEGDVYVGKLITYYFKHLYCTTANAETLFYIEDWGASERQALEYLYGD